VALAVSHYLSKSLGTKVLSGYFLGISMHESIRASLADLAELEPPFVQPSEDVFEASLGPINRPKGRHSPISVPVIKVKLHALYCEQCYVKLCLYFVSFSQEDLILVDPDFFLDYPPLVPIEILLPRGYKFLYARNIPAAQMPLLLQRSKIVLDLGKFFPNEHILAQTQQLTFVCVVL
jgi:hypothetical protein